MEEVIKYFEALEARMAAQEERLAALEAQVKELQNRPAPEPEVSPDETGETPDGKGEEPVEVIKEVVVEKPVVVAAPVAAPEPETPEIPEIQPEPVKEEPVKEEVASPNATLYGKAVTDIRQAISLGDRFLYQRELFGQNAELMQRTLTELDGLASFDEAVDHISRFNWDTESSTYQQFLITLHRRFG